MYFTLSTPGISTFSNRQRSFMGAVASIPARSILARFAEWLENSAIRWDVHAVFVPERPFDFAEEVRRLRAIMDEQDNVNLFISEGAGVGEIVAAMEAAGEEVPRDPFGHRWFLNQPSG